MQHEAFRPFEVTGIKKFLTLSNRFATYSSGFWKKNKCSDKNIAKLGD